MTRFAGLGSNTASYLAKDSPFDDIGVAATIDSAKTEIARAINNARETGAESIFNAQKEAAEHYMDYGSQIGGIQRGAQLTSDLISAGTSLATAGIKKGLDKGTGLKDISVQDSLNIPSVSEYNSINLDTDYFKPGATLFGGG